MLKKADKKFKELGFNKVEEDEHFVHYERYIDDFNYTQEVDIQFKVSGNHLVHSYDKHLFDTKGIGNTNVGMNVKEMKLCIRKMKEKGWI